MQSPFQHIPDMAGDFFTVTHGRDDYLVRCTRCNAAWFVTKGNRGVPVEAFELFRPIWHVFERHGDALK